MQEGEIFRGPFSAGFTHSTNDAPPSHWNANCPGIRMARTYAQALIVICGLLFSSGCRRIDCELSPAGILVLKRGNEAGRPTNRPAFIKSPISEVLVYGVGDLVGAVLNRGLRVTGNLLSVALELLRSAFSF